MKSFPRANPTYMMTAKIADNSGSTYVTFYREIADSIMGGLNA